MAKNCFCKACRSCSEIPNNCSIRELEIENTRLREALKFYADERNKVIKENDFFGLMDCDIYNCVSASDNKSKFYLYLENGTKAQKALEVKC